MFTLNAKGKQFLIEANFFEFKYKDQKSLLKEFDKSSNTALKKLLAGDDGLISFDNAGEGLKLTADRMEVLTSPQILTKANSDSEIYIISEAPIQYFEKMKDGNFALKEEKGVKLGLTFKVKVIPVAGSDTTVKFESHTSISVLKSRKKIDGVNLPVGAPIISERKDDTTATVALGKTVMLSLYKFTRPNGAVDVIATSIKVNEYDIK